MRLKQPCPANADRSPTADGWYCRTCAKDVIDLTRLTKRQAQPLIDRGGICVRLVLAPNGEPVFAPEPRGSALRSLALAGALAIGCAGAAPREPESVASVQGPPMSPDNLPVGVAADEVDHATLTAWQTPPDQEGPMKVTPRPHAVPAAAISPAPLAPLPPTAYPQEYEILEGGI
jgi:hypothetical protein